MILEPPGINDNRTVPWHNNIAGYGNKTKTATQAIAILSRDHYMISSLHRAILSPSITVTSTDVYNQTVVSPSSSILP